ncbi:MAG: hypothetical protein QHC90_26085 [Shinella sp.]|nr:hypothetical protein [Shinella sp.]
MRQLSPANQAALADRRLVPGDFLWITARTYDTGTPFAYGFWSGVGNITVPVLDPDSGSAVNRNFEGSGSLIQVGDIPLVSNISVRNATITLSQIDEGVASVVRGYDLKQARVEIYRGLFSPETRRPVDTAFCRFVGFVDDVEITTPSEGEAGSIVLTCASHTQEMTRSNPDTRSDESQKRRAAGDNFYQDTTTVGEWEFFWGGKTGKLDTAGVQRIGVNVPSAS